MAGRTRAPKTTNLTDDTTVDAPQSTDAGDAPADTYDASERVSSTAPDKATAATAGHQSVNAVQVTGTVPDTTPTGTRTETYTQVQPDGTEVTVTHNYDTGETTVAPVAP